MLVWLPVKDLMLSSLTCCRDIRSKCFGSNAFTLLMVFADTLFPSKARSRYTVVVPVSFEKNKANFTYVFDKSGTPTSLTVDVNYTLAQNMEKAALNTVMGLGTVFVILAFLIFVISLFKYIPGLVEGKKKESTPAPAAAAPAPVAAPVAEPAVEDVTDDGELIAVIAAAIAASEGKTSTDGFVVRSIRKVNRRKR